MSEPSEWVDANYPATFKQRIEDGIVFGSAVILTEEMVFAAHHGWPLASLHGVVVDLKDSVVGMASQPRPWLVGVVQSFTQ